MFNYAQNTATVKLETFITADVAASSLSITHAQLSSNP